MRLDGIRGVTFDAGGTLIGANPGVGVIYAEVAAAHGIVAGAAALENRFRETFSRMRPIEKEVVSEASERMFWRCLAREVFAETASDVQFEGLFPDLWSAFADARRWRLLPGVASVLTELRGRDFKMGVVSNFDRRLHGILSGLGARAYFDGVFISAEIGVAKPDRRIFDHVALTLGLKPNELVHVGDSAMADAAGALGAEWSAVIVGNAHPGATTIGSMAELPGLIN